MGRLYNRILKQRIEKDMEDMEEQSGFRVGWPFTHIAFVLQWIFRKLFIYHIFVDLEKAYTFKETFWNTMNDWPK